MSTGGSLSITAKIDSDAVRVEICDTGSGMTAAVLDRILEPFYTTKDDGNGLGLSISQSVIWDIGGDMNIKSTEGEGTSVMLSLPVLTVSEEETDA
jgi:signal transduction histidine kinase